jgi:hypothetical protein
VIVAAEQDVERLSDRDVGAVVEQPTDDLDALRVPVVAERQCEQRPRLVAVPVDDPEVVGVEELLDVPCVSAAKSWFVSFGPARLNRGMARPQRSRGGLSVPKGSRVRVTTGSRRRLLGKDTGAKRTVSTVETIGVTRRDSERLFDAAFWQGCEREADQLLRMITGVDDDRLTPPADVAGP